MSSPSLVEQQNLMIAAVEELFDEVESEVKFPDGRVVKINAAKVKDLKQITLFVQTFVASFDPAELLKMLAMVSRKQEEKLREGESPYLLDTEQMVRDVTGEMSIIMDMIHRGLEAIGQFVPVFTDLTVEEFEELELDDAAVIAFAVFGRNYHFFTRQVLPVVRACLGQHLKNPGKKKKQQSDAS